MRKISVATLALLLVACTARLGTDTRSGQGPDPDRRLARPTFPKDARDEPDRAERFALKKRLGPGMTALPTERLIAARAHAQRLPVHSARAGRLLEETGSQAAANAQDTLDALAWTALGPGNIGGRTRVLRFAPGSSTVMYAAGVAGGVWKSTNGGGSWTPKGDAMANMAVSALAIDPTNANVIYAGTGEGFGNIDAVRGAGIFKSTDAGETWTQLAATAPPASLDFTRVNDLVVSTANHNVVYAATRSGLWRSSNGGSSWSRQIDAASALGCLNLSLRRNVSPDTLLASCGTFSPDASGTGLWRSSNANGATPAWSHRLGPPGSGAALTLANLGRASVAFAPSNGNIAYALVSCSANGAGTCGAGNAFDDGLLQVLRSDDAGQTWTSAYASQFNPNRIGDLLLSNPLATLCVGIDGLNQGWYDNVIAVDPVNPDRVYAGGIDLFRSDDGGASWGAISYWWDSTISRYAHADHHVLTFHPNYNGSGERRMYNANDGGIFVSSDAATATRATTFIAICPDFESDLRGATWSDLNNGYGVTQYYHGTPYPNGLTYFGGTQDNGTTRGSDAAGPNSWTEINGGDGGWTALNPNSSGGSTVLYAETTDISIEKSTNNGTTFQCATDGIVDCDTGVANDCGQFINPFVLDTTNPQRLYTSGTRLWRTTNAASTWTAASAPLPGATCEDPFGERFSALEVAPTNASLLIAGTDDGQLCRLSNATGSSGATLLQSCSRPAGAGIYISSIAFDPTNATRAYATVSTFGVGHVWRSTNSGVSWIDISGSGASGLPDVPAHTVAVSPFDPDTLYVGTDVGVFVTTDGGGSWAREHTGFPNVITERLVFNAVGEESAQLFAFTHGRGAFRTTVAAPPPPADLALVLDDGETSVKAGAAVTYEITVTNPLTRAVQDVTVADAFPAALTGCAWTCSATSGGSCNGTSGNGNIQKTVSIGANGSVEFSATCTLSGTATGTLVNSASVAYAPDPNLANNADTDTDTIVPRIDLAIAKSDGLARVDAGATVEYQITVSNPAAVAATSVQVTDSFPAALQVCTWTCSASPGGSCGGTSGNGNINRLVTVGANGTVAYAATCTLGAASTGTLANTATATYANDPVAANNSATDSTPIDAVADLSIAIDDGSPEALTGAFVTYTIVASNGNPSAIQGVQVADQFPPELIGCAWTCGAPNGGSCNPAQGTDHVATTLSLPANGSATVTTTCRLSASASGTLVAPATVFYGNDPNAANDSASDTDAVVLNIIFADAFE